MQGRTLTAATYWAAALAGYGYGLPLPRRSSRRSTRRQGRFASLRDGPAATLDPERVTLDLAPVRGRHRSERSGSHGTAGDFEGLLRIDDHDARCLADSLALGKRVGFTPSRVRISYPPPTDLGKREDRTQRSGPSPTSVSVGID